YSSRTPHHFPSFPTRRSSDLTGLPAETRPKPSQRTGPETQIEFDNRLSQPVEIFWIDPEGNRQSYGKLDAGTRRDQHTFGGHVRSEEHTSELQSRFDLVCRLL